jgi:hypothetical protein
LLSAEDDALIDQTLPISVVTNRRLCLILALLVVLAARLAGARGAAFSYALPPDFLNLSPGAPSENFSRASEALVQRSRRFAQYAVILKDDQVVAELTVSVDAGNGTAMDSVDAITAKLSKQDGFRELERELLVLQGVTCAKLEFSALVRGVRLQKVIYVLPLGEQRAWVALEARAEDLPQYRASFEASVTSVRGLQQARDSDPRSNTAWVGGLLMAMGAGAALRKVFRRSSKTKPRRRSSST